MDVLTAAERLLHVLIAGGVGEDAQLDLAVVGVHQHAAGSCHKVGAQLAAQLGADRDVLQVGIVGRKPSGAGFGLVEAGVDAAVLADDLQKPFHIGRVQLLVGAELQDVLYQRVLPQGFQRFGVGGPAPLRFFAVGQTHGIKQHFAQLLCAVWVEADAAGFQMDAGEHLLQLRAQLHAELLDAVSVYQHADAGHIGQNLCQRKFDLLIERILAALGDLGFHFGKQVGKTPCVRVIGAGKGGGSLVDGDQHADLIFGGRSIQQIGCQLAVPLDAAAPAARSHGFGVEGGRAKHIQRHVCVVQQAEKVGVFQRIDGSALYGVPAFGLQDHIADTLLAHDGRAGRHQIVPGGGQRQCADLGLRKVGSLFFPHSGRDAVQTEAGNKGLQLKLLHQAHGFGFAAFADLVGTLGSVDGGIGADGAEGVAQFSHRPFFQQVLSLLGLDARVVDVLIHALQRAEVLHKGEGAFFTNALYAGDVVRGVAHQALHLNELLWRDAVFLADGIHIHGHGLAAPQGGGCQQYGGGVADQLQAVPVSCGEEAVVLPGSAGGCQRAENVVRLPAFGGDDAVAKVAQNLFQHRHLLRQLFGHAVAGSLVAFIHFVTERGGFQVKSHSHLVGFALSEQGVQDIQKTKNGVGIAAVLGGQQLDAKKSTVGDAVAVDDQ